MAPVPRPKVFPVKGGRYSNDWGGTRSKAATGGTGKHQGTDIFQERGTPVMSVESGVVTKMGPSKIGGNRIWINGRFYYAHLDGFAAGLKVGSRVRAGQVIGYLGDTGDAKGTDPHLHLGYDPSGGHGANWKNPFPVLQVLEKSGEVPAAGPDRGAAAPVAPASDGSAPPTFEPAETPPLDIPMGPELTGVGEVFPGVVTPGGTSGYSGDLRETWRLLADDPYADEMTRRYAATLQS